MKRSLLLIISFVLISYAPRPAFAAEAVVDRIYHPYVLPNEREFEWRISSRQSDNGNELSQRLAFGQSIAQHIMLEAYIIGERDHSGDFKLQAYEIETRWMLTQQGQYWADWGILVEFEKQHKQDNYELATALLFEKEFGRTSLAINTFAIYEWNNKHENELEGRITAQLRYRWIPQLQPAIELYYAENFIGVGPAFMGIQRYSGQKQLKWEASFIAALDSNSKDHTFRFAIEYEF